MTDWSWHLTPPSAGTGSELPAECLEWLGVDLPSVSPQEEKKEGETDGSAL